MSRGRPSLEAVKLDKWVLDNTDYTGERSNIKFDRSKTPKIFSMYIFKIFF